MKSQFLDNRQAESSIVTTCQSSRHIKMAKLTTRSLTCSKVLSKKIKLSPECHRLWTVVVLMTGTVHSMTISTPRSAAILELHRDCVKSPRRKWKYLSTTLVSIYAKSNSRDANQNGCRKFSVKTPTWLSWNKRISIWSDNSSRWISRLMNCFNKHRSRHRLIQWEMPKTEKAQ